jgi:polyisoprenoid-binding protein YceI
VAVKRTTPSRSGLVCAPILCALLAAVLPAHAADAAEIDPRETRIGFTLKTRWGQVLQGRFPRYSGRIETLDDGRRRVRLSLSARDVEIVGHPNYTGMTRGRGFFEADRFPEVVFVSDPYPPALVEQGGKLGGELTIRDVSRRETFAVEAADCARPGYDCDVSANGSVRRGDYGVDRWIFAVSDHVRFSLRLRVREDGE